ncbi:hypothetical protein FACS189494_05670 [Spirochaetia bacterium]|nr:hypothetical protein FACS189494_05670 [Spirochaetia bacterium]
MQTGILYVVFNKWIRNPQTNEMPYKIGITKTSVAERYYGLGLKMPGKFETLFAYKLDNYERAEQLIQGILNKYLVNGEWFDLTEKELDLIKLNCETMGGELVTDDIEKEIESETETGANTTGNRTNVGQKDTTQYVFNGKAYGKGRLVLAVVKEYFKNNPSCTLKDLQDVFLKYSSYYVVDTYSFAENVYKTTKYKRYFMDSPIVLNDGEKVAVCREWGRGNIDRFIKNAKKLGFQIEIEK